MDGFDLLEVEVDGGVLRVARRGSGPRAVLALHGLAGSLVSMSSVGREFGEEFTFLAPDLRGRGASCQLPGPYGLDAHVRDCIAILDSFGITTTALTGHSMGGFVAARFAALHPERAESVTLIDGGLPLPIEIPEGVSVEDLSEQMLGPVVENISRTFPSKEAYLETWSVHPALGGLWNDELAARFSYEISGEAPEIKARTSVDAVRADWADLIGGLDLAAETLEMVRCPIHVFRSPRGLLNQPTPTLSDELIDEWSSRVPGLVAETIEDTNHLTIGLASHATARIAEAIRESVEVVQ